MLQYQFDYAPEVVFEVLCDPDFVVERSLALGDLESECEVYEEGEHIIVASKRQIERDLPAFLKKVFDPVQHMELTEKWLEDDDGGYTAEQHIIIHGVPLTISAEIALFPTSNGCCYRISQSAAAKVPLIARKLEKYALGEAEDGVEEDMRYLAEYLEDL